MPLMTDLALPIFRATNLVSSHNIRLIIEKLVARIIARIAPVQSLFFGLIYQIAV